MARSGENEFFIDGAIPPPHRLSGLYRESSTPSLPTSVDTGRAAATTPAAPYRDDPFQTPRSTSFASGPNQNTNDQENLQDPHGENPLYMPSAQFGANAPRGYANVDEQQPGAWNSSAWNEKPRNSRAKWIVIGSIVGIAVIIGVAVGVGVGVAKSKNSSNKSGGTSSGSGHGGSGSGSSSSGDPSNFDKDPALKQSFFGIAYTPEGSQLPDCGNNIDQVITDIQLLSQLTTRIRLYGSDCNQSSLVLDAIQQTKVNMTVWLGNYNVPNDAGAAYDRQRSEIETAINAFGTDHIGGITVGNEFMLNYLNDNGATDPNSAVGNTGAQLLIQNITDTRQMLKDMNLNIPVGTSDAGAYFNNEVLAAVDYGMANVHPWFADTTIQDAAPWTFEFFQDTDVAQANAVPNKPSMYIAETGWPTNSSNAANATNGAAVASVANLQIFMDNFVCQANANNTQYFFFEYFDEIWKDIQFGGVEGYWGLFYANRTLKAGLTIPDCSQ